MLDIDNELLMDFLLDLNVKYESQAVSPLFYKDWFEKAFPIIQKEYPKKEYPYEVRIAPSAGDMLKTIEEHQEEIDEIKSRLSGDELNKRLTEFLQNILQPERILIIEKPFMIGDTEIWFGDTKEGINLRLGYENGDSRYPNGLMIGSDLVHAKFGGATGTGKSVLMNQIIVSKILEYPPWELNLNFCDFKFTEMVRYVNTVPTPHVKNVVACDDIDYVISLIQNSRDDMTDRQELFSKCDVADVKKFRKKFDLVMPQRLMEIDEVQQLFTKNVKRNPEIEAELQAVTKLGRSLGDHLLFASQSMKNTISKDNLANFKLGGALYCEPEVSDLLLGNDQASELRGKGKVYVNTGGGKKEENRLFRVPFIEEDKITGYLIELNRCYEEVFNEKAYTAKYDEKLMRKRKSFEKDFSKYDLGSNLIIGDAVRYKTGDDFFIETMELLPNQDSENILALSMDAEELFYFYNLIKINNEKLFPNAMNFLISGSPRNDLLSEGMSDVYDEKTAEEFNSFIDLLENRKMLYDFDKACGGDYREFYEHRITKCEEGGDNENLEYYKSFLTKRESMNIERQLKLSDFGLINVYVYDCQSIREFGRDPKPKVLDRIKNTMFDSTVYGIRFILFTSSIQDINPVIQGINHRLIGSAIDIKDGNKMQYTENIGSSLVSYVNRKDIQRVLKAKKYNLEIPNMVERREVRLKAQ